MTENGSDVALFHSSLSDPISDEAYTEGLIIWSFIWIIICSFGIWSNVIIIRTFVRMGLDDSITISFFALGVSDFGQVFFPVGLVVVTVFIYVEARFDVYFKIQPYLPSTYLTTLTALFNNLTIYITTFLAIQRCLCIIQPLHFKNMFSKSLTWCLMVVFFLLASAFFIAYTYVMGPMYFVDPYTNRSYYILVPKAEYPYVDKYVGTITTIIVPLVSQCIVVISVAVMIYGLKASVRFRKNMTGVDDAPKAKSATDEKLYTPDTKQNGPVEEVQGSKERTAIVQVVMLSSIYLITSLPKVMHAIAILVVSGYGVGGVYENVFKMGLCVRFTFDFINSSVNFFIYNKYNTRFRKHCFGEAGKKSH